MILKGRLKKISCFIWAKCHLKQNYVIYVSSTLIEKANIGLKIVYPGPKSIFSMSEQL